MHVLELRFGKKHSFSLKLSEEIFGTIRDSKGTTKQWVKVFSSYFQIMDTGAVVVGEDNICDSVDGGKIVMIGQQTGLDDGKELCDAFEGEDGQNSGKTKDSQDSGKTKDSQDSGKTKDSQDNGKTKDSQVSGKTKDSQDSGKTKDSQDSGKTKVSGKTKREETQSENSDEGSSNDGGVYGGELSPDLSLSRQSEVEVDTKLSVGSKPEHIVRFQVDSIAISLFVDWFSLLNPNPNDLMMRRAGWSNFRSQRK